MAIQYGMEYTLADVADYLRKKANEQREAALRLNDTPNADKSTVFSLMQKASTLGWAARILDVAAGR